MGDLSLEINVYLEVVPKGATWRYAFISEFPRQNYSSFFPTASTASWKSFF